MKTFRSWGNIFVGKFLTDVLLLAFALAWLVLIFVPLIISPSHIQGFVETNMVILSMEISVCVFAVIWAFSKIVSKIKRERKAREL